MGFIARAFKIRLFKKTKKESGKIGTKGLDKSEYKKEMNGSNKIFETINQPHNHTHHKILFNNIFLHI